jgi:hypothetical protein
MERGWLAGTWPMAHLRAASLVDAVDGTNLYQADGAFNGGPAVIGARVQRTCFRVGGAAADRQNASLHQHLSAKKVPCETICSVFSSLFAPPTAASGR